MTERDVGGYSALHVAARLPGDDVALCKRLLEWCSDPQLVNATTDGLKQTALHRAVQAGNRNVCQLLLDYGADRSLVDALGKRAADYVRESDFCSGLS